MKNIKANNIGPVAFFVPWYRAVNETFVSNELLALQERGIAGSIYYEKINHQNIQPINRRLCYSARCLYSFPFRRFYRHRIETIYAHVSFFLHRPIGYIRATMVFFSNPTRESLFLFVRSALIGQRLVADNISLIYVHDGKRISKMGIFCSYISGIPCGIIFHTEYVFAHPEDLSLKIAHASFSIFQSRYSKQYVIIRTKATKLNQQHAHVISSPGVNIDFFQPHRDKKPHQSIRILSVGRLEEMKGFDRLIHAVKILRNEHKDVICVIVGYGSQKTRLEQIVRTFHLEKHVLLVGPIGHTKKFLQLMNKADIFVLPSHIDSKKDRDMQPNAIKEAMSMKLIVITSALGGIREVIQDGYNGFLIQSATSKNIVRMIKHILALSEKEKDLIRQRARETIVKKYNEDAIIRQLISIFHLYAKY
ncbi:glycosyltransferase [Candidatus Gottesmanbacteria bacterium]|nr:glycosyltransferase [Candidatus Gottesmanbacteria bacterium]